MDATPELTPPSPTAASPDNTPSAAPTAVVASTLGYEPFLPDLNRPGPFRLAFGLLAGLFLIAIGLICFVGSILLYYVGQSLNAALMLFASPFLIAIGLRFVRAAYAVLIGKPPPNNTHWTGQPVNRTPRLP